MIKYKVNSPVVVRYGDKTVLGLVEAVKPIEKGLIYHVRSESGKLLPPALVDDQKSGHWIDSTITEKYYAVKDAPIVKMFETNDESTAIEMDDIAPTENNLED